MIKLYNKSNIDELKNQVDLYEYFAPIIKNGTKKYIENINCDICILQTDDLFLPVAIANKNFEDSLYVSLFSHYIQYCIHEFSQISNIILKYLLKFVLSLIGKYLKFNNFNKVIYVNCMFLSTNLYPDISKEQIKKITQFLTNKYSDYAIVFKNICKEISPIFAQTLKDEKFNFIISRQILYLDETIQLKCNNRQRSKIKKDYKLLKNALENGFQITKPGNSEDFRRIYNLYYDLYITKYSIYNPKYTTDFFELVNKNKLFELDILKDENEIMGMSLIYINKNTMTAPAVGYDMSKPSNIGLYRMIMANLNIKFKKNYKKFNQSAGVADFKMQRGAKASIEYMAIYYKHLKLNRKIMYKALEIAVNTTIPILCKNKLCGFVPNKT